MCWDLRPAFTGGTFQLPSSNDGGFSVGQYGRIMKMMDALRASLDEGKRRVG